MASTPMAIDSPLGAIGRLPSALPASNGIPATAKIADVISQFRPTKYFRRDQKSTPENPSPPPAAITSLDFSGGGDYVLTSESDNTMHIYDVIKGRHHKTCLSQKYGVGSAIFTHKTTDSAPCIIHSGNKVNHDLRYLSTHDMSYIRYFDGHEGYVTSLSLHPGQDNFLSCSEDNTVRIWDAGTKQAVGRLNLNGAYLAAWDPSGNVFAVASPIAQSVLLYDFRNFDKAPFTTIDMLPYSQEVIPQSINKGWNKLEFSNDGKSILVGTTGSGHLLLDAFSGDLKAILRRDRGGVRRLGAGEHNPEHIDPDSPDWIHPTSGDACFTPDGKYVMSGARRGKILVWDTLITSETNKNLKPIHELEYQNDSAVIAWNPKYNMFATGDKEVVYWVPDRES